MKTNAVQPAELTGRQFRLVPFREQHISDRYVHWLNDPEVNRFLEVRWSPQSIDTVREYVRSFYGSEQKFMWGIYPIDGRDPVGTVTLAFINPIHLTGEIGIMVGEKDYWGSGASGEAISLVCEFAFDRVGLRRVVAGSYAGNRGMNFTFTRLGFAREGRLRSAFRLAEDTWVDGFRWGLLRDEWRARPHDE